MEDVECRAYPFSSSSFSIARPSVTSTVDGSPTPCLVTSELTTIVVATSTATAYATRVVSETVVEVC
jgi:hypothetical protein